MNLRLGLPTRRYLVLVTEHLPAQPYPARPSRRRLGGAAAQDATSTGSPGQSTPAYFKVWNRGGGTLVANRHSRDSGSMSTAIVPSV